MDVQDIAKIVSHHLDEGNGSCSCGGNTKDYPLHVAEMIKANEKIDHSKNVFVEYDPEQKLVGIFADEAYGRHSIKLGHTLVPTYFNQYQLKVSIL